MLLAIADRNEIAANQAFLGRDSLHLTCVASALDLERALLDSDIDLAVIDHRLSNIGESNLINVAVQRAIPVIVLIDPDLDPATRAGLLEGGVFDCVRRPYQARELWPRARQILGSNRAQSIGSGGQAYDFDDWRLDVVHRALISAANAMVRITGVEFDVLRTLLDRRGRVVPRGVLAQAIGHERWVKEDRSIDVAVANLRRKLGQHDPGAGPIKSVRGVGYVLAAKAGSIATM